MLGATPVVIAIMTAALGHERIWPAALGRAPLFRWPASTRRGARARVGADVTPRRPDDVRRGLLLGDLHARRRSAHDAALAGRRHGRVDGDRHALVRAGDAPEAASRRRGRRVSAGDLVGDSCIPRSSRSASPTRSGTRPSARSAARGRRCTRTSCRSSRCSPPLVFLGEPLTRGRAARRRCGLVGVALTRVGPRALASPEDLRNPA